MPKENVVVIGGGMAGLCCAHQLVQEDHVQRVLVVDAMSHVGGKVLQHHFYEKMIKHFSQSVRLQTNWTVASINFSRRDNIVITSSKGERISCSRVVLTIPKEDIEFIPEMPNSLEDDRGFFACTTPKATEETVLSALSQGAQVAKLVADSLQCPQAVQSVRENFIIPKPRCQPVDQIPSMTHGIQNV